MKDDAYLQHINATAETGYFFIQLAQRAEGKDFPQEGDLARAASSAGIRIPPELEGATFELLDDRHVEQAAERSETRRVITIDYPPEKYGGTEALARTFKKCFKVCKSVGPAKVCIEVCVTVTVGWGGIDANIKADVTIAL